MSHSLIHKRMGKMRPFSTKPRNNWLTTTSLCIFGCAMELYYIGLWSVGVLWVSFPELHIFPQFRLRLSSRVPELLSSWRFLFFARHVVFGINQCRGPVNKMSNIFIGMLVSIDLPRSIVRVGLPFFNMARLWNLMHILMTIVMTPVSSLQSKWKILQTVT